MSKKRYNVVYGEKYGDVNDPKTSWKRCGSLFVNDEDGRMSIKLDMIPVGSHFQGWLSVFEPRDNEFSKPIESTEDAPVEVDNSEEDIKIDLSEIPF